ncbi:hypothetical protein PIB30_095192, partial [Stylosanthes scabra]|nr:hypothetical protein [Stylosanthes scabra]
MTATRSPRGCGEDGDGVDAAESDAGTTVRGRRRSSDCNSRGCCGERRRRQLTTVLRRAMATATHEGLKPATATATHEVALTAAWG